MRLAIDGLISTTLLYLFDDFLAVPKVVNVVIGLVVVGFETCGRPNRESEEATKWEILNSPTSCRRRTETLETLDWSFNRRFVSVAPRSPSQY